MPWALDKIPERFQNQEVATWAQIKSGSNFVRISSKYIWLLVQCTDLLEFKEEQSDGGMLNLTGFGYNK
jgi:hypothetical protein